MGSTLASIAQDLSLENKLNHKIWITSGLMICILSFCLPVFAMQPFWFGYSVQTEPVINAFWCIGILSLAWLLWTYRLDPNLFKSVMTVPIVWAIGLFSGVGFLLSIFHAYPLLTWTGATRLGEGCIGFLVQALLAAVFITVCRFQKLRKLILILAITIGTSIAVVSYLGSRDSPFLSLRYWKWAPYYYPDYFGYIGIAFIGYFACLYREQFWARQGKILRLLFYLILIGLFLAIVYGAENKALTYGFLIALSTMIGMKMLMRTNEKIYQWLPLVALGISVGFILILSNYAWLVPESSVNPTILGRSVLLRFTFLHFIEHFQWHDLWHLIFGRGFGTFRDFVLQNVFLVSETSIFSGEVYNLEQESLNRDFFHSHNRLAETFLSLGVLGVAALCFCFYAIIRGFKKQNIIIAGVFLLTYLLVESFWFQLNATVPFCVLAFCLLSEPMPCFALTRFNSIWKKPKWVYTLGSVILLFLIVFTSIHISTAFDITRVLKSTGDDILLERVDLILNNRGIQFDKYLGNKRAMWLLKSQSSANLMAARQFEELPKAQMLDQNLKAVHALVSASRACSRLESCAVALNIYGELAASDGFKSYFETESHLLNEWRALARLFLEKAPNRADMMIPYLNYVFITQRRSLAWEMIHQILMETPDDPVALWYSGSLKLDDLKSFNRGIQELKMSLDRGIGRFVPISEKQIELIQRAG